MPTAKICKRRKKSGLRINLISRAEQFKAGKKGRRIDPGKSAAMWYGENQETIHIKRGY